MRAETCPICDGATAARPAMISPFLVERCGLDTTRTLVRLCAHCEFVFFERRLSPAEAGALYKDYRGELYNTQRLRHEPNYTVHIAQFNDAFSPYYRGRIRDLVDVLNMFPEINPASVLDFGGDGAIPKRLFAGAEISHDDASAGADLRRTQFDLVFASQVFEHLSDPRGAMREIASKLAADGLVVLDLPRDYAGPLPEAFVMQGRQGGPMNQMHEHINYFSFRASRRLLEGAGLEAFFEVETPFSPVMLTIAGRPGSALLETLRAVAPQRRMQWSLDRLRDRQAEGLRFMQEQFAALRGRPGA